MDWFSLALIAAAFFATYTLIARHCLKDQGDAQIFAVLTNVATGVFVLALTPFDRMFVNLSRFDLLFVVLASGFLAGASLLFIWARQLEEVSRVEIGRQTTLVWTFVGAVLVLGETFTLTKSLGIGLILLGTVISLGERHHIAVSKGLALVLTGTVFAGMISVISRRIVEHALSPTLYSATIFLLASLWLVIVLPNARTRMTDEIRLQRTWVLLVGAVSSVSAFFLMKTYQVGEASLVRPVYHTSLIFSVVAGIVFMQERDKLPQKVVGAFVAFGGVVVLRLL